MGGTARGSTKSMGGLRRVNVEDAGSNANTGAGRHFAHAKAGLARERWHLLDEHLRGVASLAACFASRWGAAQIGYITGLWHDFGKYAPDWQTFLIEVGEEAPTLGEGQPVGAV